MEATFKITWDNKLGQAWMNVGNLTNCLVSDMHIGENVISMVVIEGVEPKEPPLNEKGGNHGKTKED